MKKTVAIIMALTVLAATLSGCVDEEPAPEQSTISPVQSETAQTKPSVDKLLPATDTPDIAGAQEKLTEFESDFGYTISYEENSFDYRRTEGYDEFVLKSGAVDKPFVFICISHVDAEFVVQVKAAALGDSPESCTIGQAQLEGQCAETEEDWDGGRIIRKTYVCPIDSGDALLIETQWYTEQADDPYAAWLLEMVNSIRISEDA